MLNSVNSFVCKENECNNCKACIEICPKNAIHIQEDLFKSNAIIDNNLCINCNLCKKVCPNNIDLNTIFNDNLKCFIGYSLDEKIRSLASSGGICSEIMNLYLNKGFKVFSCLQKENQFLIVEIKTFDEVNKCAGSKYVKSTTNGAYKLVKNYLKNEYEVVFFGLPCQIAGLKSYLKLTNTKTDKLLAVDLICHGSPSSLLFKKYLDCNKTVNKDSQIFFRKKGVPIHLANQFDIWDGPFLDGTICTDNCYSCKFANKKRCSDITLGDSIGIGNDFYAKGLSLILANSTQGLTIINKLNIFKKEIDFEIATKNQVQLSKPISIPAKRNKIIFSITNQHDDYKAAIFKNYKKEILKSLIKKNPHLSKIILKCKRNKAKFKICYEVRN